MLAERAAERKRRSKEQEKEAELELLVKSAEEEAERRVKRYIPLTGFGLNMMPALQVLPSVPRTKSAVSALRKLDVHLVEGTILRPSNADSAH